MTFEEKNYRKNVYLKISKLYLEKKYREIIKEGKKYLDLYPRDVNVRFMYSKSLRHEERFDEAIENLKIILSIDSNNSHATLALFYLYYFLRMYDKACELLPMVSKMQIMQKQSLEIMKLVMKKECNLNNIDQNTYIYKQITNYNEFIALAHIKEHLTPYQEQQKIKKGASQFNNIDIKYLYDIVKNNLESIKDIKRENTEEVLDVYYFGVSNIGFDDQNVFNYIKVVVIPNTFDIISIYPTLDVSAKCIYNLKYDHDKLFKNKLKTYSRIDKFNKKYNMSK